MKEEDKLKSVKRFGSRYGRKLKLKFAQIESEQRKEHKCPYCSKISVRRLSVGIWQCKKCNSKFTGRAYTITRKIIPKEIEEVIEEPVEAKEEDNETEEIKAEA